MKTGRFCDKAYRCASCGKESLIETNHWGQCYPLCSICQSTTVHECLESAPIGVGIPEPWRLVKLGDICQIKVT